jgi:hypothetical protein
MSGATVGASPWIALGLATAVVAGLLGIVAQMVAAGASFELAGTVLNDRRGDVVIVVIGDVLGAGIAVGLILFFGVSNPHDLVWQFQQRPALAWVVVGLLGPAVSTSLGALLGGSGGGRSEDAEGLEHSTVLGRRVAAARRVAARRLLDEADTLAGAAARVANNQLLLRARQLIAAGALVFQDVDECITDWLSRKNQPTPPEIMLLLVRGRNPALGVVPRRDVEVLVETALHLRLHPAVRVACAAAEGNSGTS